MKGLCKEQFLLKSPKNRLKLNLTTGPNMKFFPIALLSFSLFACADTHVRSIEVQGHRGARGLFPENTLPAFAAAIEAGTNTLELDLHVTKDGEIVIHHDYFINGELCDCLDGDSLSSPSLIRSLELSDIKKMDCGSKTNPDFPRQRQIPGTQIPTLDELFEMINASSHPNAKTVRLNLEIKRDPRHPELTIDDKELAAKIVSKVREKGFSHRVYYSSFDPEVLMRIYQLDPKAELGFLFNEESLAFVQKLSSKDPLDLLLKLAGSFKAKVVSPEENLLTDASFVRSLQKSGFRVVAWTVNSAEQWAKLIEMGVDGLITDYPQDLLQFLNENKF